MELDQLEAGAGSLLRVSHLGAGAPILESPLLSQAYQQDARFQVEQPRLKPDGTAGGGFTCCNSVPTRTGLAETEHTKT